MVEGRRRDLRLSGVGAGSLVERGQRRCRRRVWPGERLRAAGGDPDGLSHFLLGFLASEPGVGAGGGDATGDGEGERGEKPDRDCHPPGLGLGGLVGWGSFGDGAVEKGGTY